MKRFFLRSALSFFVLGITGLCFWGCAGFFRSENEATESDPYFLLQKVREHASRLESFQGQAVWTAASDEGAFRGTTRVVLKTPDSLWLKVEGPFGIDIAYVSVTGSRVLLFSPMLKAVYDGEAGNSRIGQMLPFGLTFSKNLLGAAGIMVPSDSLLDALTAFYPEKNEYVLDFQTGDHIRIQKKGPVVSHWEKRDSTGMMVWSWEAERFKKHGKIRIPQMVRVITEKQQSLTVFYESLKTNPTLHKGWCDVPIPEGVEAKNLKSSD